MMKAIQHNISLVILSLGSENYQSAVDARQTLINFDKLAVPQLEEVVAKSPNMKIRYHAKIALREIAKQ